MGRKTKVGAAAGIAAAAAAGAYFLYGKDAEKHRDQVKGWALKAKGEMLEKLEVLKEVNRENYHNVVEQVARRYRNLKTTDNKEVQKLVKEVKGYWNKLAKKVQQAEEAAVKTAKKTVKKAKSRAKKA